ncbi:Tc toxin subunit A-related protein [Pseudomonas chlororaphis]|uniref:Tc toxin subunit A-related protein n=1 Tax=Pseudomonas chlororaphis TaxID=587753 RepID=UPI00117A836B|nr:hypothetical protein [Pseudomonas chlororaphis]
MISSVGAEMLGVSARLTSTLAGYERRAEEWQNALTQSQGEVNILTQQLAVQALQIEAQQLSLELAELQAEQYQTMYSYLSERFTNQAFYQWMVSQLSSVYYQMYDAALSLCLMAQASYQFEMGDDDSNFIPTNTWNDDRHGLCSSQPLQQALIKMKSTWLQRNERRLNIVRTVSLREYWDKVKTAAFAAWDGDGGALESLRSTGTLDFVLPEALFDNDFPGHYLRQIAEIEVSLPVIVGPYQNVRATLVQTSNALACSPSLDAVQYLNDGSGSATNVKANLRASQEVVLSTGQHDNGVLPLYAGDGRYGPFEGTGLMSKWTLTFPTPASDEQKDILASIPDVIVKISYTAKNGAKALLVRCKTIMPPPKKFTIRRFAGLTSSAKALAVSVLHLIRRWRLKGVNNPGRPS